ncbi:MAG: ferredoxin [Patescibacteria group bacterium]|nr:ferredoxin [Patescibacteria group bacterium]
MAKIAKVEVKRDICIGATPCVVAAPAAMELDAENKAVYKLKDGVRSSGPVDRAQLEDPSVDDDTLLIAAQSCPVKAIFLYDETGKQVYPEA